MSSSGDLSKRIANLSPEKRAELLKKMAAQKQAAGTPARAAFPMRDRSKPAELSFAQQRLWFMDQLAPGSPLYNVPVAVRLEGAVDVPVLERSLLEVVRRHESLRTTFQGGDSGPVQHFADAPVLELERTDVSAFAAEAREAEAWRRVREGALRPFDLATGPLMRALLVKLGDADHLMLVAMHHIVSDGWSLGVLVREVAVLYAMFLQGQASPLPELAVQYADYAAWQRETLQGAALERQLAYWREQLSGAPPALELTTDKPRPVTRGFRGARTPIQWPRELTDSLRALAQREGATLFMVLLAGWQSLLSRYSGQDDVSVGSPMAGRTRSELEGLIGMFVNTLVLRARLTPELSFQGLVRQLRETMVGATDHQDVPFEKLVEALQPERDSGRTPFFQAMFALQNAPRGPVAVQGLKLNAMEVDTQTAKFDLLLQLTEAEGNLSGYVEYDTDLFHAATVARMVEHLRGLLESAVAHPAMPVARLPMVKAAERNVLAVDWNRTQAAYPRERPVHALFAEQARKAPDRVAVVQGVDGRTLTYGELDAKANQLAHHLRGLGVKRGTRVGVYVDRSWEMVVGLLGILKAGGAYVPVDRNYPADRIALLLEDAGVEVTLTQQSLVEKLPAGAGTLLCVDAAWESIRRETETAPDVEVGGEDLAYIIFTSGSTGRPKGVCVPHRGITRLVLGNDFMRFGPDAIWSQTGPVAFDASTLELWGALLHGAKLVLAPPHALTLEELGALVKQERVSVLWLTTALYEQMALHQGDALAGVSQVLTGGDVMPLPRAREHLARLPEGAVLVNAYGPTENTTFSTTHTMTGRTVLDGAVSIGKPIGNSTTYVLDAHGDVAGVGVPGELHVGGEGLAWGYLNRADLTAERFVPHLFSTEPGARLYRTGDKARWREDGTLEFLGRTDFQVKVRGFRIELGEIEAALLQHPDVAEATVVARGQGADKQLVGYAVAKPERTLDAAELKAHLRQRLPEYMVPTALMSLDALPLSANGKVDRKALPEPEAPRSEKVFEAPRTETEAKLAAIWAQVLRVPQVGVTDNFFELGGHSLLATQVASRIRAGFGVELPLRELFESATLEALALRLERAARSVAPPLVPVSREQPLPLSFAQQRLWFIDQLEPGSPVYNVPLAVRLEGALDVAVLQSALDALVRRHEALRTTFTSHEGTPVQVVHPPSAMPLEVEDLRGVEAGEREQEARRRVMAQGLRSFDLSRGPLVRAQLVRLDERDHLLALTMHHAISDGWSLGVLVREIGALYAAFVQGQPSTLPELPLQYADYAAWQRGWLRGDALEREVSFWKGRLAGAPAALELPTDRPRPAVRGNAGTMHFFQWSPSLTQRLRALAQREGASLYMVLLTGWQVLLSRYSGQTDISVGSPIAGRTRAELEGLIGFFVNTLVMRARVDGETSFRELLKQVRGTVLEAYEHQDVPFEKLVEALHPERSLSHTPLFQTLLALQNVPQGDLGLPGMALKPLMMESRTSKFDLSVFFVEEGEGLRGSVEYSTELYDAATVRRMVEHLRVLLDAALSLPEAAVSRLPMVDAEERQRILDGGNRMAAEAVGTTPVHVLFSEQARKTPDAVAIQVHDGRTLTYAELDAKANQLAHHLRSQGVKRGTRVGVYVERSLEMVAGLLAILKAGGAYVPVDRNYPAERIALLLGDAGVGVTLTQRSLVEKLPASAGTPLLLDTVWAEAARHPETAPRVEVSAEDLAYVMFTSGSTGRPKGVSIPHRGITRLVVGNDFLRFGPEEVWLQLAPVAFDASTLELWGALLHGAKLVLAPPHALALEELGALLRKERISTLWLTAALYEQMALHQVDALAEVSRVLAGGDVLPAQRVREHLKRLPEGAVLVNGYGPTENTTFSATHVLTRDTDLTASVPIGKPIGNSTAYVLEPHGDVAGVGVPGELFVGGEGLAWGYLNRTDLTAERFVPNAFSTEPGSRLYRTGDKARWKEDGTLEFLGRTDFQVKVRGFRIELGEVEAALLQQPDVAEAAAVVRDVGGDKRLVAWLVAKPGQNIDPKAVEAELRQRLPEYMVPSAMGVLEALPLTANGKVDRKALMALEAQEAGTAFEAPRTEVEKKLAAIWAEVLRVPWVGLRDNFFSLGGHSLLATQVVSRIRSEFGVEISLRVLFEAPVLEVLAERLGTAASHQSTALKSAASDEAPPLSFAQQRLWFIDQMEPGSAIYNVPVAVRLRGTLKRGALVRALDEIVRRHESLRTTFELHEGQPVQRIHPHARLQVADVDLEGIDSEQREAEVRRRLGVELAEPFDLQKGPLIRASLLKLGATEHVLFITMHHIVSDGWSLGVLIREVGALYAAFSEGRPSPLPELSLQYAGYAAWQRGWLQGETLQKEVDFWRGKLAGTPPVLELPTDHPRPAVRGNAGAVHSFVLPSSLEQGLKALAQREGASLYMVLLAAWQMLLSRYSGQTDISVGSPIAGRTRAELEGLIGFFVNTLVLHARVDGEESFRELLTQLKGTVLEAYEHQDVPFEKLVEALQPERSLSHTPLFQSLLALQNTPEGEARLPGLTMKPLELEIRTSKFDVSIFFTETAQGLSGAVEYSTDLFEAATVRRMVEHLRVLLEGVVAKPEEAVGRLPMLTEAERQQVLLTWNPTATQPSRDMSVHARFEAQAKRTPDAVALKLAEGGGTLTYGELDAKANQLAHHLRSQGVKRGTRVGVYVERSLEMVAGLLAILKAGGAYVPVDRNYPAERIALLLGDAGVGVTLTQRSLVEKLPASAGTPLLLDTAWSEIAHQPTSAPQGEVGAEDLAYVMFTSGSTGRPKGVSVPHRGITRLVVGNDFLRFGPEEVWLQLAPVAFDASTLELWGALLHGAKLVLAPPHAQTLEELGALLRKERISTLWLTAALYEQMALHQVDALAEVSQVLAGGDVLPSQRVREHLKHLPEGAVLVNGYGPTENTTFSATHALTRDTDLTTSVPIGKPIGNSTAYVLDEHGDVAGVGVPGELYVGGEGLAWGYLNRTDLTAERFVPNAFSTEPGSRLYRTGDKARWKEDGTLEFLGRTDFQVKVRGFRIELGEVEAALLQHPDVAEAVAVVRDVGGDKRLVAWLVAKPGQNIDPKAVEAELRQRLPEYMVPSAMGVLDALPLTANGKVDRKALPEVEAAASEHEYAAPRTESEQRLAAIWAEVLRVPRVGVRDNFFALGGHSLLATQVVSRIRKELGAELPLRTLFEAPTLEALARRLETAERPLPVALASIANAGPSPLSFAQQRLWFIDQLEPGSALYNVPVAVRLEGELDVGALDWALREIVRRHESLRTTFELHEGQPVQRIHADEVRLSMVQIDLGALDGEQREAEVRRRLGVELAEPFDLYRGPLIRASLLKLGATEHVMLITMHHIVSDGWSLGVLIREVGALYSAFTEGRPSPLPELSLQYAGYAAWQRGWLQGETLQKEVDFWRGKLAGTPPVLELPTDRPRPAVRGNAGAIHPFVLPSSLEQGLKALAQREGASLYMVLLAAWQALLSRYSGQADISVGSPIAGRTRAELEGLIGFFVNTLVLRAQVDGEKSFRELLTQVKGTVLEAYEHQDVPFEKLVEALQPERSLSHTPLFQSLLALQNTPDGEARLPGLTMKPLELELRTSKFDVSIFFTETPQGLSGAVEYSTDLFDAATVHRMVEHLRVLLEGVVAKPEEAVGLLPMLTDAERQQVLVTWNQQQAEYARDATIPQLFEAQAKRTPDAVAVVSGKQRLTYRELEAKANQLAHRLRKLGVGPESRVGLCVERTADV
ncbi:non-ribosomal peptide synthetase, partial [Corallococcus exiguus]|uniref:non-ribosomal peptide synthetase n=1 Tax=Corallococcus exiguus TaxID=83462 RepID=UPI001494F09E